MVKNTKQKTPLGNQLELLTNEQVVPRETMAGVHFSQFLFSVLSWEV